MPVQALENSKQNQVSGTESTGTMYANIQPNNNDPKVQD